MRSFGVILFGISIYSNMKTKITYLIIPVWIMVFYCQNPNAVAGKVDIKTAENVALNLYAERSGQALKNAAISRIIEEKEAGETVFYVMVYSSKGFAIISAEDAVKPILGYSFESAWNENDHAPAFEFYILERFRKQIYAVMQAKQAPEPETMIEWQYYSKPVTGFQPKNIESFIPLTKTLWDQDTYFNTLCPADLTGPDGHAYVGCVATAMAQVLNYWQHPWHGTGSHSYTPESNPGYGVQSADFSAAVYNFDNMPDTVNDYYDDLAELMYHCAVSVDMDFGNGGSGAWVWGSDDVSYALETYFYFNDAVNDLNRSSFPGSLWTDLLKEDLDLNRPVIYGANDTEEEAGHAWVLDAYTTGDMFHCNWGWSGSDNGWFSIDNFCVNGYTFDDYETACVHIYPKFAYTSGIWTLSGSPYLLNYDHIVNAGSTLTIEPGVEVIFTGRYKLEVRGRLLAEGTNSNSVIFTSELPEIGMRGVRFINTNENSMDSSKLIFCRLENGKGGFEEMLYQDNLYGGAVYCLNSSKVLIANSMIKNSSATFGGGIACTESPVRIRNCLIRNDSATMGGGIYLSQSNATLSQNMIEDNQSGYSNGGGIYCNHSDATFNQDTISDNSAKYGGGLGFSNSNAILNSVVINYNYAGVDAGGIYAMNSDLTLNNVMLNFNLSELSGGAILCFDHSDLQLNRTLIHGNNSKSGSAIAIYFSSYPELMHVTIADNGYDPDGEAIYIEDAGITIENSILWGNFNEDIDTAGSCSVSPSFSIIEKGIWPGIGVIKQDPLLSPLDYHLTWDDYPLPDGWKSAAIDKGNPVSPLDPDGTLADLGYVPFEQIFTPLSGGNINGTLTFAGSPYFVTGNLQVPATDQLIIEPCVSLIFQGDYELKVLGRILADGTNSHTINFAPADTITGWQGIRFINNISNGQDSSLLDHCRITFGNANGSSSYANGGALLFSSSGNVRVSNSIINKNKATSQGGAVYIGGTLGPKLTGNIFENNYAPSGGAIFGIYTSINLYDNILQNNKADYGGAIYVHTSNFQTAGNTIRNNRANIYGGGLYIVEHGTCSFSTVNKSNIYLNYAAAAGLDLFFSGNASYVKQIVLDTFSVQTLNEHFAYPLQNFNITKINSVISQVNSDLYISMTGSDDNPGTNPESPLKTMYMACMKILADASNPHTIHLAEGTYSEGATGEVFPVNWRDYVSMKGSGIEETTIYGEDKNQLLWCYNDNDFTIDSITFQGGYGEFGGAIRLENGSSPLITNVEIKDNFAFGSGGGLYCKDYSSPQLSDVKIFTNNVNEHGGGAMFTNYCDASLNRCEVYGNFAYYSGGGLCATMYSDLQLDSISVYDNEGVQGGGIHIYWGGLGTITNSAIYNNTAQSHVAGYVGRGGGIWISYYSNPVIYNVEISGNQAEWAGGGIMSESQSYAKFTNCLIAGNTSKYGGGLALDGNANHRYWNTIFYNNTTLDGHGAAITSSGSSPVFTNVTITGNEATGSGQGGGTLYNYNSTPQFKNCILWNNLPTEIVVYSGSVNAQYSDIEGSYPGAGNINIDPLFESVFSGNFSLEDGSPCIDAGNPDTTGMSLPLFDYAGNIRIVNDTIDIGAFEFQNSNVFRTDFKVFLEGPFNGTDMNINLSGITGFPLSQPYNAMPWNYIGMESVLIVPTNVVDWSWLN